MTNILPPENDLSPTVPNQKPSRWMPTLLATIVVLAGFSFMLAAIVFHPVQAYGAAILVIVVTAPCWFMAARAIEAKTQTLIVDNAVKVNAISYRLMLWASCVCFALGIVYTLNGTLDTSLEETFNPVIVSKDYVTGKHGLRYYAIVTPVTFMDSQGIGDEASLWLDSEEHISVSRQEYELLQLGVTRADVTIKRGFFGIPWVVRDSVAIDRTAIFEEEVNKLVPRTKGHNRDFVQGLLYAEGRGVTKDETKAAEFFTKAAEVGDAEGQYSLAVMYSLGQGGLKQDWVVANQWLRKAAEQGYAMAQDDLGVSYGDGRGIEQDWVQSYMWIDLAAKQGEPRALKDIHYAEKRMTLEQIEEAKRLSNARHKTEVPKFERAF